jgi:lipid-A-disaccharide synthase
MRILISTGEASGDAYGAALVRQIKRLSTQGAEISGSGGHKMAAEGVQMIADSRHWGAISIMQALKVVPRVAAGYFKIVRELRRGTPGLFIPIDFGYTNIKLARRAKTLGWRVLYFVPPGSWRRDRQGRDLPLISDSIVTPFSWSAEILNEMGAEAHWFGHPIKQLISEAGGFQEVERTDRVAILPGSRRHEIQQNLPLIAESVRKLDYQLEFALASTVERTEFQKTWEGLSGRTGDLLTVGETYRVLRRARAGIVCSGTATLEAAICRCPMVVIYKLPPSTRVETKVLRLKRPNFVALPNILLDRDAVPELVEQEAQPVAVRSLLDELLVEGRARESQLAAFEELEQVLGPNDAITRTAELALALG